MQVLSLIEKLEQLLEASRRIPLTGKLVVDEETLYALLDELRTAIPEDVRQAKWITIEKDRILAEARQKAENLINEARQYVRSLADETSIAKEAQQQAESILEQARQVAKEIRVGALEYAEETLEKLSRSLEKALEAVKAGKEELRDSRP